jgi:lysozyme
MKKLIVVLLLCLFIKETLNYPNSYLRFEQFYLIRKLEFKPSEKCVQLIKWFEGFNEYSYWDNGMYSIGFGTRKHWIRVHQKISQKEAEILMQRDIDNIQQELNNSLKFKTQGQIDAIFSIGYNRGVPNLKKSRLFYLIKNNADINDILFEFTAKYEFLYNKHPKNLTYRNLYNRRIRESQLFVYNK